MELGEILELRGGVLEQATSLDNDCSVEIWLGGDFFVKLENVTIKIFEILFLGVNMTVSRAGQLSWVLPRRIRSLQNIAPI